MYFRYYKISTKKILNWLQIIEFTDKKIVKKGTEDIVVKIRNWEDKLLWKSEIMIIKLFY